MKYRITLFLLSLVLITACNKDNKIKACIELDKSTIEVGDSITFTSCSENEWSYIWRFSGPDTAAENSLEWSDKIFTHPFNTPGNYIVVLKAFNNFSYLGDSDTDSIGFSVIR